MVEPELREVRRLEVITRALGRQRWSAEAKSRIVAEILALGVLIALPADTSVPPVIEVALGGRDRAGPTEVDGMLLAKESARGEVGGVILPDGRSQVVVATKTVDYRKGMDSLAAVVQERLRLDPFSGAVYVFPRQARRPGAGLGR